MQLKNMFFCSLSLTHSLSTSITQTLCLHQRVPSTTEHSRRLASPSLPHRRFPSPLSFLPLTLTRENLDCTPLHVSTLSEIAAIVGFVASFVYLLSLFSIYFVVLMIISISISGTTIFINNDAYKVKPHPPLRTSVANLHVEDGIVDPSVVLQDFNDNKHHMFI